MAYKFNFDRKFKLKILDDTWEFYLITTEEAVDLDVDGDGFRALTETEKRCIFVVEGSVTKGVIGHELYHAFVSYFNLGSAEIDIVQFEEINAEFIERDLDKFLKIRNKIYNRFRKLEGSH